MKFGQGSPTMEANIKKVVLNHTYMKRDLIITEPYSLALPATRTVAYE